MEYLQNTRRIRTFLQENHLPISESKKVTAKNAEILVTKYREKGHTTKMPLK